MKKRDSNTNKCPLCNTNKSEEFKIFFHGNPTILQCINCGFVFHNESIHNPDEEKWYERFCTSGKKFIQPYKSKYYEDIADRILNINGIGNKLLDIGCRDGHFISICEKKNFECYGIEPSPSMCEFLREKKVAVKEGYYKKDMFNQNSFDIITFIQVLEHIPNPFENALSIANYHLKDRGYIVIEVPSMSNPKYYFYKITKLDINVEKEFIIHHCNYFTPKTLISLASKAGFKTISLTTGRLRIKYRGFKRIMGLLFDPIFNYLRLGGILYIGQKSETL